MFGYEKLPVFENVERKITLRTINIAFRRAKLYSKRSVILKEIFLFSLLLCLTLTVGSKVEGLLMGLIIVWPLLSIRIIKSEFDKFVIPLLPKALEDAQKFPEMVK